MTKEEHAKNLQWLEQFEPKESHAASLKAGAAALRGMEAAKAALRPFAEGGVIACIERGDFSIMRERIIDWHGPDDFKAALAALRALEVPHA